MAKISELTTDASLDVLCEITPYLSAILEDEKLTAELRRKTRLDADASKAEIYTTAMQKLAKIVPVVLKTHRDDVYGILAAVNGKTPDEISKQNSIVTLREIADIVTDKEFRDFFTSLQSADAT